MKHIERKPLQKKEDFIGYWQLFVSSEELERHRSHGNRAGVLKESGLEISKTTSTHKYPIVTDKGIVLRDVTSVSIRQYITMDQLEGSENKGSDCTDWRSKSVNVRPQKQKIVIDIGKTLLKRVGSCFSCVCPIVGFQRFSSPIGQLNSSKQPM